MIKNKFTLFTSLFLFLIFFDYILQEIFREVVQEDIKAGESFYRLTSHYLADLNKNPIFFYATIFIATFVSIFSLKLFYDNVNKIMNLRGLLMLLAFAVPLFFFLDSNFSVIIYFYIGYVVLYTKEYFSTVYKKPKKD